MLGLLILPALLGLALIVNVFADDDDTVSDDGGATAQPEVVEDGYIGNGASQNLSLDTDGGNVNGGGGNDTITGSENDDGILGGDGNDVIYAGGGDDVVSGDAGNDRIFLGDGDDEYTPDDTPDNLAGNDFVRGGAGNDVIIDILGSNELRGDLGRDILVALDGINEGGFYDRPDEFGTTDTLDGGFGNDILLGDDGDLMTGGAGLDTFFVTDDEDPDFDEDRADRDLREVRITDFDTDDDELVIVQLDGLTSAAPLELTFDSVLNAVRASYEGRAVAILEGLGAADIPNIQVSLVQLDGLDLTTV